MDIYIDKLKNNEELTNFDLMDIAKHLNLDLVGIYRQNELPSRFYAKYGKGAYIINLDTSGPGTHWVSVVRSLNKIFYGDSYGNPMPDMIKDLFTNGFKVYECDVIRQDLDSNRCGWYCLLFLLMNDGKISSFNKMNEILVENQRDKIDNENWLENIFDTLLK